MSFPSYTIVPNVPEGYILSPLRGLFSVIVPEATTNLVTNPSFELATTSWTASNSSIARSTTQQRHGAYALGITPSAASGGAYFGTVSLTSGTTYTFSLDLYGVPGVTYRLYFATTGGVQVGGLGEIVATGHWQRFSVTYPETSTTTRRLYVIAVTNSAVYYIDGVQCEAKAYDTTYCDGDQRGLVPNQAPPPYAWTGTAHGSTSMRSAQTRAGGRVYNFDSFGFKVLGYIGLGMTVLSNLAIPRGQLDGAQFQRSVRESRQFAINGVFQETTFLGLQRQRSDLRAALERDATSVDQPIQLQYQSVDDCGTPLGDTVNLVCAYAGGLDETTTNYNQERLTIRFTQFLPLVSSSGDGGVALTVQTSVTNANGILQRTPAGVWQALGTGLTGAGAPTLLRGADGKLYAGGAFTAAGGVANTRGIAYYDPSDSAWHAMGTGLAVSGSTYDMAFAPDGKLVIVGLFTSVGGVANTANIARWTGSAWESITASGAANAVIRTVAFDPSGNLYVGGALTSINGVAVGRIAKYDGTTWTNMAGISGGDVESLAVSGDGTVYAGGAFTTPVKIGKWTGAAWVDLSTGLNGDAASMVFGLNGLLFVGGGFTTAGGVTANHIATWNGTGFVQVGSGANQDVLGMWVNPVTGAVYMMGSFTIIGGITVNNRGFIASYYNGVFAPIDMNIPPSGGAVQGILAEGDGTLTAGFSTTGTATAIGITTATNSGTARTYPTIVITGPSSGTAIIYQISNLTTGKNIYMEYTISAGEVATLILEPDNISFTSTFSGNILSKIQSASDLSQMWLQPGANSIGFLSSVSTVTAVMRWQSAFESVDDATF